MKKWKRLMLAVLVATSLPACQSSMIRADAIDGSIRNVTERHDAYVNADESLSQGEKDIYLRSSELLRRVVEEAKK